MGYEIVPRRPAGLDRSTSRELPELRHVLALECAAAVGQVKVDKQAAEARIDGFYDLADQIMERAYLLDVRAIVKTCGWRFPD